MKRLSRRPGFALFLGILLPGLGHAFWREYLFGLFVFLVMLIASVLVFFSFLVTLPLTLQIVLFGLPAVFFVFTFVDLGRAIRRKRSSFVRSPAATVFFALVAITGNTLLPLSPTNLFLRNLPGVGTVESESAAPLLERGDVYLVQRAAYRVNLFFLDQPYLHARPERWDLIAFEEDTSGERLGVVIGYGGEEVAWSGDTLVVDGVPQGREAAGVTPVREIPLTRVETGGILVATLDAGVVDGATVISDRNIVGKVYRLF